MARQKQPHNRSESISQSHWQALTSTAGLLAPEVSHVLDDFASFTSPSARAVFADKWISLVASRFEDTWQVLYQLFKLVETEQLYTSPELLQDHQPFATFQAYWEAKSGKAFEAWLDLEQTYAYVCAFKPELIKGLYATAKKAALAARNHASATVEVPISGQHLPHDNNKNVVMRRAEQGNAASYALRRLAKDRPDLHAQCLAGELTAHAAMVQAGFRTPRPSQKRTPLESLQHYWRQVSPEDRLRFLCEMLTPNERRAIQVGLDTEDIQEE